MALTPEERSLRARIAAHTLHGKVDDRKHTAPARAAFLKGFELAGAVGVAFAPVALERSGLEEPVSRPRIIASRPLPFALT